MSIEFKGQSYNSLTNLAGQVNQNKEFADFLRKQGTDVIQNAQDVFWKINRSEEEAQASVNDLKDLCRAFQECKNRVEQEQKENLKYAESKVENLNQHSNVTEKLKNAPRLPGYHILAYGGLGSEFDNKLIGNDTITNGKRVIRDRGAYIKTSETSKNDMKSLTDFASDLNKFIGLYACTLSSSGPVASTVERLMDGFTDLESRIQNLDAKDAEKGKIEECFSMTEYETKTVEKGFF